MAIDIHQCQNVLAASHLLESTTLFNAGNNTFPSKDNTNLEDSVPIKLNLIPTLVVTIIVANLQAI